MATTILYNGKICTSAAQGQFAEAVAIKECTILATGTAAEMDALSGPETTRIDLQGRTVIPGINDAHIHMVPINSRGIYLNDPNLFIPGPGPALEEFLALIAMADAQVPEGVWFYLLVGESVLDNPAATRFALDEVAPTRPVIMLGWTGHQMHINTAVMQALGISENEPDPFGGFYERVEGSDVLTGILQEYTMYDLWRRLRMNLPPEDVQQQLAMLGQSLVQMGITSVQDMGVGFTAESYEAILQGANLPVRVRNIAYPMSLRESRLVFESDSELEDPAARVITSGVKWISDGTPVERNAALAQPYSDLPEWSGIFNFYDSEIKAIIRDAQEGPRRIKRQRLIHATGDAAIDTILDTMSVICTDRRWQDRRLRIEHGDMIRPDHIPDLAAKEMMVVQNPTHFALPELFLNRIGPQRMDNIQPLRSLIDGGVKVAFGSDVIGVPPNPYFDMMMAVIHPSNPAEGIGLMEALSAYTEGGAYAEFLELYKGTLETGKFADLAVLSQDIFDPLNFGQLPDTFSVLTIVNGEIVWDAGVLEVEVPEPALP